MRHGHSASLRTATHSSSFRTGGKGGRQVNGIENEHERCQKELRVGGEQGAAVRLQLQFVRVPARHGAALPARVARAADSRQVDAGLRGSRRRSREQGRCGVRLGGPSWTQGTLKGAAHRRQRSRILSQTTRASSRSMFAIELAVFRVKVYADSDVAWVYVVWVYKAISSCCISF